MRIRPTDSNNDILPVLTLACMTKDTLAVADLVRDRLNLLSGEWWENSSWGCEILDMIRSTRVTEQSVPSLVSYLSSYIQATPGVLSVEDVRAAVSGRQFSYYCRVITSDGSENIAYSATL